MQLHEAIKILKHSRKQKGIRQPEIAGVLKVSCTTISNYETLKRVPDAATFVKWCEYLGYEMRLLVK